MAGKLAEKRGLTLAFDADALLDCYRHGLFPMGEGRDDPRTYLVDPPLRGVLPLDAFHAPQRLMRTVRSGRFRFTADEDFAGVMDGCARASSNREDTWINGSIRTLYLDLHRRDCAHSIECWREGRLVGGLYGVRLGGAFFGESMFSVERDASKAALVHLVERLKAGGFQLLDCQFLTAHLAQFGVIEIPREDYLSKLSAALKGRANFWAIEAKAAQRTGPESRLARKSAKF